MPQGWGDSQPCTDFARIDVSDAQVGTEKRALRSNQETDEGKLRRPGQLLDNENPIQGFLGVYSCFGLHTRAVTVYRDTLTRGFSHFVTSMTAPVASG